MGSTEIKPFPGEFEIINELIKQKMKQKEKIEPYIF